MQTLQASGISSRGRGVDRPRSMLLGLAELAAANPGPLGCQRHYRKAVARRRVTSEQRGPLAFSCCGEICPARQGRR